MNFNQAEEEYIDGEDTIGLGTLGKEGSGRYVNIDQRSCIDCSCIHWLLVYLLIPDESFVVLLSDQNCAYVPALAT